MTIIVEDGTGVTSANSYATVAALLAHSDTYQMGLCASDVEAEAVLLRAQEWIHYKYGNKLKGSKVSSTQALDFPRAGVYIDGEYKASNVIPREVIYAQLNKAIEFISPELFLTDRVAIASEELDGVFKVVYANSGKVLPVSAFARAETLLSSYLNPAGFIAVRS